MEPFVFRLGNELWPPHGGITLLHVYAEIDLDRNPGFAALVEGCRAATAGDPLTHVGDEWFHITLAQIPTPAAEITDFERKAILTELGQRLHQVEPFTVTAGSPLSYSSGVLFDLGPDEPLNDLRHAVATAIQAVRGVDANPYETGVLHLTESYSVAHASSDDIQRKLRRVRPSHAPIRIDSVTLVDVQADNEAKTITWQTLDQIPLRGA